MEQEQIIKLGIGIGALALMGVGLYFLNKIQQVKKSVGWGYVSSLAKIKNGLSQQDLVLEIVSQSGRRTHIPVTQKPIIEYTYKENGKDVKKGVIFDERAVEFINGVPVMKCTPLDIRPIDRDTGLLVNIPSEMIDKLAVDSSKLAENEAKYDKERKMLIWALIGMAVLFIIALSYINQTNTELQSELARVTIDAAKSATVIAN